jgi:hypothetical protein
MQVVAGAADVRGVALRRQGLRQTVSPDIIVVIIIIIIPILLLLLLLIIIMLITLITPLLLQVVAGAADVRGVALRRQGLRQLRLPHRRPRVSSSATDPARILSARDESSPPTNHAWSCFSSD